MSPSLHKNVSKAYVDATRTVAKTRQVVMLYDGAIRFIKQAREDMVAGNIEERFNKLVRAGDIIMGLQSCLDFDHGGEPAKILYGFYSNIDMRLIGLNRTNDLAECDRILEDLKQMRDVWDKIDRGDAAEKPAVATPDAAPAPVTESVTFSA